MLSAHFFSFWLIPAILQNHFVFHRHRPHERVLVIPQTPFVSHLPERIVTVPQSLSEFPDSLFGLLMKLMLHTLSELRHPPGFVPMFPQALPELHRLLQKLRFAADRQQKNRYIHSADFRLLLLRFFALDCSLRC